MEEDRRDSVEKQSKSAEAGTVNGGSVKKPPLCKKCGGRHWGFDACIKDITGVADRTVEQEMTVEQGVEPDISKSVEGAEGRFGFSEGQLSAGQVKTPAGLESGRFGPEIRVEDIMREEVFRVDGEESVQHALTRMQQLNVRYLLVGDEFAIEGILSRSDLTGALSPYLRPIFSRWRRALDDATLQIKVKWIMSRPVRTVSAESGFAEVVEVMQSSGKHALPVVNTEGRVCGLVTVFDVFKATRADGRAEVKEIDSKASKRQAVVAIQDRYSTRG